MSKITEPLFNGALAHALRDRHPLWRKDEGIQAERTSVLSQGKSKRPDIVVDHPGGIPVVVETEWEPARTVEADAKARLGTSLADDGRTIEQAIAVRIPRALQSASDSMLAQEIEDDARLEFCLLSQASDPNDPPLRFPETGWIHGNVDRLASCIELAAMSEDRVAKGMDILETGISQAAARIRKICREAPAPLERISEALKQGDSEQTTRMAMAIVANAITFHASIVGTSSEDGKFTVRSLQEISGRGDARILKPDLLGHWTKILEEINYWPIFRIASDILHPLPTKAAQEAIAILARASAELVELGATSQHDLAGRMFQRLIADRKFLATFYTLPSSAALLSELAVSRLDESRLKDMDFDWEVPSSVTDLRIADFACGTGALLGAAYAAVRERHRLAGNDDQKIHRAMMEKALVGTDIMPAAVHLTASTLSGAHPRTPFLKTKVMTLPYGRQRDAMALPPAIGALELIQQEGTLPLFGTGRTEMAGIRTVRNDPVALPHNSFDLVIMNPPFTRPGGHEGKTLGTGVPSFAGFGTKLSEQKEMSKRLTKLSKGNTAGHGNAGLASNFIDVAHAKLKEPDGVLALVIPFSFLQGVSWQKARNLLQRHYDEIVIVSIAATGSDDRAFSADTGMAEILLVAKRRARKDPHGSKSAHFVNLRRRPRTLLEGKAVAWAIAGIMKKKDSGILRAGASDNMGRWIHSPLSAMGCAGLKEPELAHFVIHLEQGELSLPGDAIKRELPLVQMKNLGNRGLHPRDISGIPPRGPFDSSPLHPNDTPLYPALYNHDAKQETKLTVAPDSALTPRKGSEDDARRIWNETATRLHFNRDFRLNSQPLAACMTPEKALGGRAWPNFRCTDLRWERALALWANTTLGLISFWWIGTRQQQGRAILTITKLPELLALDPRRLSAAQLDEADRIFAEFEERTFLPANEAWRDETRQALDKAMLMDLLGLPEETLSPLDKLRMIWCAEPSVHGGKRTSPLHAS